MNKTKSFEIPIELFYEAFCKVKSNKGCAGVDRVTIGMFEKNLDDNLYKIWNRISSGCYFPPPVLMVKIPKDKNSVRILGIPQVSDRVAQQAAKIQIESKIDSMFHKDSYGYRPNKSAIDAVKQARIRCWKYNWAIDIDIKGFFDNIDHKLMMEIIEKHIEEKWVKVVIQRWLKAPAMKDGELINRDKGTPQGGVISPLLANMFLDKVFDKWMEEKYPNCPFERYADDIIVHCHIETKPKQLLEDIKLRFKDFKLQLHPQKTKITYCKDDNRKGKYCNHEFNFLGFTFKFRNVMNKYGKLFLSFLPAISSKAKKSLMEKMRSWKISKISDRSLEQIAELINPTIRGWINYYGKFYKTALWLILNQTQVAIINWARKKFKICKNSFRKAFKLITKMKLLNPNLFAHWSFWKQSRTVRAV